MKSRLLAAFLAFFFGMMGLHKWYLGDPSSALMYFLITWIGVVMTMAFGLGVLILIPLLAVCWIESAQLLFMSEHRFNAKFN